MLQPNVEDEIYNISLKSGLRLSDWNIPRIKIIKLRITDIGIAMDMRKWQNKSPFLKILSRN